MRHIVIWFSIVSLCFGSVFGASEQNAANTRTLNESPAKNPQVQSPAVQNSSSTVNRAIPASPTEPKKIESNADTLKTDPSIHPAAIQLSSSTSNAPAEPGKIKADTGALKKNSGGDRQERAITIDISPSTAGVRKKEYGKKRPSKQLVWGILILAAGTYLAVDGLSKVTKERTKMVYVRTDSVYDHTDTITNQRDISNPGVTLTRNNPTEENIAGTWWAHNAFTFRNTGNCAITDIDIRLSIYDHSGAVLAWHDFNDGSIATGQTYGWDDWSTNCGATDPNGCLYSYNIASYIPVYENYFTYTDVYKDVIVYREEKVKYNDTKNPQMGNLGILIGVAGMYCIADYVIHNSRVARVAERFDMGVYLAMDTNSSKLLITKRM